jgi:type I restriction enzyme S subunit
VGRKGSAGEINLTEGPFWPTDVTYFVEHDERESDLRYLFYALKLLNLQKLAKGVKPGINRNDVYALKIPMPSLHEQKRIVVILDEAFEGIDTAVANAEKNIVNARELFENYLNAALSRVDGWVDMKIGDANLLQIIDGDRGTNYPSKADFFENEYCLFLNTKNVRPDGFNFSTTSFITKEKDSQLRKGKLKRRDVVLTTRGTIGNIALYDDTIEFAHIRINSGMLIFRPNERVILSEYLFEMLRSGVMKSQITQFVSGTAQPQLPIHTLSKFSIPVPKVVADQEQIVYRLRALSNESKRLEGIYQQKLEGLAELKQSILNKAFSGGLTAASAESLVKAAE